MLLKQQTGAHCEGKAPSHPDFNAAKAAK